MFHLLFFIIKLFMDSSDKGKQTSRRIYGEKIAIFCPVCQKPAVADEVGLEQRTGSSWARVLNLYVCGTCRREFKAETFEDGGHEKMQSRTWECPMCLGSNPATGNLCGTCGYQMV